MANWNITLKTQSVRAFGPGPTTQWGQLVFPYSMTWGTSKWGEGNRKPLDIVKVLSMATTGFSTAYRFDSVKTISQSAPVLGVMNSEKLSDGSNKWQYVFPSNVNEGQSRSFANWTSASAASTTFVCAAAVSTTWT